MGNHETITIVSFFPVLLPALMLWKKESMTLVCRQQHSLLPHPMRNLPIVQYRMQQQHQGPCLTWTLHTATVPPAATNPPATAAQDEATADAPTSDHTCVYSTVDMSKKTHPPTSDAAHPPNPPQSADAETHSDAPTSATPLYSTVDLSKKTRPPTSDAAASLPPPIPALNPDTEMHFDAPTSATPI